MVRGIVMVMVAVMVVAVAGKAQARYNCDNRACPEIYKPVCGSDGKTYGNDCEFSIAKCKDRRLKIVSQGECPTLPDCPRFCPLHYDPVCGSDGKTYGNGCQLDAAALCDVPGLYQVGKGPCP